MEIKLLKPMSIKMTLLILDDFMEKYDLGDDTMDENV